MALLLIFLLLIAIVILRTLIPIVVGAILMFIAIIIVCVVFKDTPGESNGSQTISKAAQRAIGIGCVFFVPGLFICIQSRNSYTALLSGALVIGGPRPIGILIDIIGAVILICGIIAFVMQRRGS